MEDHNKGLREYLKQKTQLTLKNIDKVIRKFS